MRIVVTGATGNVGTSLVTRLAEDERVASIVGIARRLPERTLPKTVFVAADVASDDLRRHVDGADAVVHLAWLFQPTHRPAVTWRSNVLGSERVFAAAAEAGVATLVHASSVGAYAPGSGRLVDETWPTSGVPVAAYSREKAYVERLLDVFEARHPEVRVVRLRPAFIFKRSAATAQRRLFAGPLVPGRLARRGRLPVLPVPTALRFQALHADDAAEAYRLAVTTDARGAFNVAAEPVVDGRILAGVLRTRPVDVPRRLVRTVVAAAWRTHLTPADPALVDLVFELPLMDTGRATRELGWLPRRTAVEALGELVEGVAAGAGMPTAPLASDSATRRLGELATGVGERP